MSVHCAHLPPGDEVPAGLVETTSLEAHRNGANLVLLYGLIRVEKEGRRIGRAGCVEAKDNRDGPLL